MLAPPSLSPVSTPPGSSTHPVRRQMANCKGIIGTLVFCPIRMSKRYMDLKSYKHASFIETEMYINQTPPNLITILVCHSPSHTAGYYSSSFMLWVFCDNRCSSLLSKISRGFVYNHWQKIHFNFTLFEPRSTKWLVKPPKNKHLTFCLIMKRISIIIILKSYQYFPGHLGVISDYCQAPFVACWLL